MERLLQVATNVRRMEVWAKLRDTPTFRKECGKQQPIRRPRRGRDSQEDEEGVGKGWKCHKIWHPGLWPFAGVYGPVRAVSGKVPCPAGTP